MFSVTIIFVSNVILLQVIKNEVADMMSDLV
jgi:hypothetical protein